jgi:hypothetical protein
MHSVKGCVRQPSCEAACMVLPEHLMGCVKRQQALTMEKKVCRICLGGAACLVVVEGVRAAACRQDVRQRSLGGTAGWLIVQGQGAAPRTIPVDVGGRGRGGDQACCLAVEGVRAATCELQVHGRGLGCACCGLLVQGVGQAACAVDIAGRGLGCGTSTCRVAVQGLRATAGELHVDDRSQGEAACRLDEEGVGAAAREL